MQQLSENPKKNSEDRANIVLHKEKSLPIGCSVAKAKLSADEIAKAVAFLRRVNEQPIKPVEYSK